MKKIVVKIKNAVDKYPYIASSIRGANYPLGMSRVLVGRKGEQIVKNTDMVVRLANYRNTKYHAQKVIERERRNAENPTSRNYVPQIKTAKDELNILFENDKGEMFVRCVPTSSKFARSHTEYVYEGKSYTYEEMVALDIIAPSKLRSNGEKPEMFDINIKNIVRFGRFVFEG